MSERRETGALGALWLLQRLVVALALALFGGSASHAERVAAASGPAADNEIVEVDGLSPGPRHVQRLGLPAGDTPDLVLPCATVGLPELPVRFQHVRWANDRIFAAVAHLHPPVRGPPAA